MKNRQPGMIFIGILLAIACIRNAMAADPPNPPARVTASVSGNAIEVSWEAPQSDEPPATGYRVLLKRSLSQNELSRLDAKAGEARDAAVAAGESDTAALQAFEASRRDQLNLLWAAEPIETVVLKTPETTSLVIPPVQEGTWEVSVVAIGVDGSESFSTEPVSVTFSTAASATPASVTTTNKPWYRELFNTSKAWVALLFVILAGLVLSCIQLARSGREMWVRRIAALDAVDEAVGRATEMGRRVLFVPGVQDMDDIGTIAGVSILGRVAKTVARYGADLEVPTSKSLVMTACRETVQASFFEAGRPDAFNADHIPYITDDQFGYVAYLVGDMVRTRPAACLYMGAFFAESLLLAETGNAIGAIQIAGTREPAQLPFFVAACDYTLIGEEFFAASAYLSKEPDQLGSLKGQDLCKLFLGIILLAGCILATIASLTESGELQSWVDYLTQVILA